jgi:hypothetical protein
MESKIAANVTALGIGQARSALPLTLWIVWLPT